INDEYVTINSVGIGSTTDGPISGSGLTSSEQVGVVITNFGGTAISNFEVSYTINGGDTVTEIVEGPLEANSTMEYVFEEGADLSSLGSYEITASTLQDGDDYPSNDSSTEELRRDHMKELISNEILIYNISSFICKEIFIIRY
ncbi:MAG: hypothetical protein EBX13_05010, partial [Proteobacteria bacterium]|nr:hypothetical protein [Pseudomonadota bacterium]